MFESALKTLRVRRGASPEELREAYVKLVRRYPPEHFPEKFAAVKRAYNQLRADDTILEEYLHPHAVEGSGLGLLALLWGELPELRRDSVEIDFTELAPLADEGPRKKALEAALNAAADEGIHLLRSEVDYK